MRQVHIHLHPTRDAGWEESKHPRADDGKFGHGGGTQGHHEAMGRKEAENAAAMKLRAANAKKRKEGGAPHAKKGEAHFKAATDSRGRAVYKLYDKKGEHVGTVASEKEANRWWADNGGAKAEAAYDRGESGLRS